MRKPEPQHLTSSEREHYEKTIGKLQQARSLERLLLFLILLAMVVGLFLTYNANRQSQKRQSEVVNSIKEETGKINRHLDCVVAFFTRPNRSDLSIKDIDKCTVSSDKSPTETFPLPLEPSQDQPQPEAKPETSRETINPNAEGLQIEPPKTDQSKKPEEPVKPPMEILGIPVCVPFTGICVRS